MSWPSSDYKRVGVALFVALSVVGCGSDDPPAGSVVAPRSADDGGMRGPGMDTEGDAGSQDAGREDDAGITFGDLSPTPSPPARVEPVAPTLVLEGWACTRDFALDTVCDCGCGALDLACEAVGCQAPGCSAPSCEQCFDAEGRSAPCREAYNAWSCDPTRMGDGVCDCGCGIADADCDDGCVEPDCATPSCERCNGADGAAVPCDEVPAFSCDSSAFGDGVCDCGCGAHDVDCQAGSCTDADCVAPGCEVCHGPDGAAGPCGEPTAVWVCDPEARRDDVCDCGCGLSDPACGEAGCERGHCEDDRCDLCHDSAGRQVPCPHRFTCAASVYGDGVCDCGCGEPDPDCDGAGCATAGCEEAACERRHDGSGPLPAATYSCEPATFDAGDGCDCGCGAVDPDCAIDDGCTEGGCRAPGCDRCRDAAGGDMDCDWYCDPAQRGDGVCDCGCGAVDPDCSTLACIEAECFAAACQVCHDASGSAIECSRGQCAPGFMANGRCDCGCRERDPECPSNGSCVTPGCSEPACGVCHGGDGAAITCADWVCTFEQQAGGDGCNCGCGAFDPDCGAAVGCFEPGCMVDGCTTCRSAEGAPMSCGG